jgi:hypothetical protein
MTESARHEGEEWQQRSAVSREGSAVTFSAYGAHILSGEPDDDAPVQMDTAYYDEVRRAVGRGAPTVLLGTSTRSLQRSLGKLKAAQEGKSSSTGDLTETPSETAIDTSAEHDEPESERSDSSLQAQAKVSLGGLLQDHPAAREEFKATERVHIHLVELYARTREARKAVQEAEARYAGLAAKLDPTGHRVLGFAVGTVLVILFVVLNAVPLYLAAESFALDSAGTWVLTLILVVASSGAMLGFDMTRGYVRRRRKLAAAVTAGYLALLWIRTDFLTRVANESLLFAIIQAVLLTAISIGLILCGSEVLARTRYFKLSRARAAVRHARQAAAEARAAQTRAAEKLQRHIDGLREMLLPWILGSAAPTGVDQAKWTAALEWAIHAFFQAA